MELNDYFSSYFDARSDGSGDDALSRRELTDGLRDGRNSGDLDQDEIRMIRYIRQNFDKFDTDGQEGLSEEELSNAILGAIFKKAESDPSVLTDYLKDGNRIEFEFDGETYYVEYNPSNGNIEAFSENGNRVDNQVQWDNGLTVQGFMEVGGLLSGSANRTDRLYIGIDDDGNLTMIQARASLDSRGDPAKAQEHRDILLTEGTVHFSMELPADGGGNGGTTRGPAAVDPIPAKRGDFTFKIISDMAFDMGTVVNEAKASFDNAILDLKSGEGGFSDLLNAQGAAANLTATVSATTGALQSVTSATSTSAGKIGQ